MPTTKIKRPDGSREISRYRAAPHVEAQAAELEARAAVDAFVARVGRLLPKARRGLLEDAAQRARTALQRVVLDDLWEALDVGPAVGPPWDVRVETDD